MLSTVRQSPVNFANVAAKLDIDDFIDYMIINQYGGNTDWAWSYAEGLGRVRAYSYRFGSPFAISSISVQNVITWNGWVGTCSVSTGGGSCSVGIGSATWT